MWTDEAPRLVNVCLLIEGSVEKSYNHIQPNQVPSVTRK